MKKFISIILSLLMLFTMSVTAFAAEQPESQTNTDFNLIEYLKENPVSTKSEFLSAILENGSDLAVASISSAVPASTQNGTEEFSYIIDEESQLVYVKTLWKGEEKQVQTTKAAGTVWQVDASTQYEAYSIVGIHVFTVTTSGTFEYDMSSYCKVIKSQGFFNPAFLSLWSASTWISPGNYTTKSAYIDTYGTANLNFSIAEILGITLNFQSVNYTLELTCDHMGVLDAWYSSTEV